MRASVQRRLLPAGSRKGCSFSSKIYPSLFPDIGTALAIKDNRSLELTRHFGIYIFGDDLRFGTVDLNSPRRRRCTQPLRHSVARDFQTNIIIIILVQRVTPKMGCWKDKELYLYLRAFSF